MAHPMTHFDLAEMAPVDVYKLLIGLVVPRPIGWIGTYANDRTPNLAPYSFFNVVSASPPTVIFSPGRRGRSASGAARIKDTLSNVRASGGFTVNVVTEELAEAMNLTSGEYPPDVDEFAVAGLRATPGVAVDAPRVAAAKAVLECAVTQIVPVGDDAVNSVVFGTVVAIDVSNDVLDGTRVDPVALRAVGRMAGDGYTRTADGLFHMTRPA